MPALVNKHGKYDKLLTQLLSREDNKLTIILGDIPNSIKQAEINKIRNGLNHALTRYNRDMLAKLGEPPIERIISIKASNLQRTDHPLDIQLFDRENQFQFDIL